MVGGGGHPNSLRQAKLTIDLPPAWTISAVSLCKSLGALADLLGVVTPSRLEDGNGGRR